MSVAAIDSIEIYRVAMPLISPFRTAFSNESIIESLLVRMTSGNHFGWGEASPWRAPAYSSEWASGAFILLRDWLAPALLGKCIVSGDDLEQKLSHFKGNFFAKSCLDLAWWDLEARRQQNPLWKVLGGTRDVVDVGADFGVMAHLDELITLIGEAVAAGFKRVKLKFRPGWELNMIEKVRQRFPDMVFHVDCNSAYSLADLPMFQALDRYGLAMIEQPLAHDDLVDHATLQSLIETPICLDESITGVARARKAAQLRSCRWINIKPGRVGGLTVAREIHDLCLDKEIGCWIGGMLESAVGASHCIALATLQNIGYPSDIFPSSRFYRRDLARPEIVLSGPSEVRASGLDGIGCVPDPEMLQACQIEWARLEA